MRLVGFSTGAILKGDVHGALTILAAQSIEAVELSALRLPELEPLVRCLPALNVEQMRVVSVHAPTKFERHEEAAVIALLDRVAESGIPIVVHPDSVVDWNRWTHFAHMLLLENMDKRKPAGRNMGELRRCFDRLPDARWCFDIAHARQVDPSMIEAFRLAEQLADRLALIHISELSSSSRHERLSSLAFQSFQDLVPLLDANAPAVIESVVDPSQIAGEVAVVRRLFAEREPAHEPSF